MKSCLVLMALIVSTASQVFAQGDSGRSPRGREMAVFCSGSSLVNSRGRLLEQYTFDSECREAVSSRKGDLLCSAKSFEKVKLFNVFGRVLAEFTFRSDCTAALNSQKNGLLCASEFGKVKLMSLKGGLIREMTFASDCQKALDENKNGFACLRDDRLKMDLVDLIEGVRLFKFIFPNDCDSALNQVSRTGLFCADEMGSNALINSYGEKIGEYTFASDCEKARQELLSRQ